MSEEHSTTGADHASAHGHEAHHGHAATFSEAELADFQKSDIGAGTVIISLLASVFTVGLVLYTCIATIVAW